MLIFLVACTPQEVIPVDRHTKIPSDITKMSPETDDHPPILHSDEYEQPVPLATINTAGAEDSPFIPAGSDELYFFFTPDVRVPVEKQLIDGVTGIYVSKKVGGAWQEPTRVMLQDPGKLSLDGCEFIDRDTMWFCTAREGYDGLHWATAKKEDGRWSDWKVDDFPKDYQVGELHISSDGNELYFHSQRRGSKGQDIWMSKKVGTSWRPPVNLAKVNSEADEGYPYLTPDGKELWFNRQYQGTPAIFRSKRDTDGTWLEPEMIISQFAGEPTLDKDGNIYFVHHYFKDGVMLEADIYISYKK